MNHIKKLQLQLAAANAEVAALKAGMESLERYARSDKFAAHTYVNTADILLRLQEQRQAVAEVECLPLLAFAQDAEDWCLCGHHKSRHYCDERQYLGCTVVKSCYCTHFRPVPNYDVGAPVHVDTSTGSKLDPELLASRP